VGIAEPVAEHRQAETPVPPEPETREDKTPAEEAAPVPEPVPEPEPEPADEVDETAAIREWARSQGIPVSVRGRIPQDVRDRYHMEKS
jgi:hypothetical protein